MDGSGRCAWTGFGGVGGTHTRWGDEVVLKQVAALEIGDSRLRLHAVVGLIRDVKDPGGAGLLEELYLEVEKKGERQGCEKIRKVIYRYVDQDLMDLQMSDSRLVGVMRGSMDGEIPE